MNRGKNLERVSNGFFHLLYISIGNGDRILVLRSKDVIFNEIYAKRKLRIIIYGLLRNFWVVIKMGKGWKKNRISRYFYSYRQMRENT